MANDLSRTKSNNISFPANDRSVVLLIDGKVFRAKITKNLDNYYKSFTITYKLYDPDGSQDDYVAYAKLELESKDEMIVDPLVKGVSEIPDIHFILDLISVKPNFRGIGTSFFNYILNDISNYNSGQEQPLKLLILRATNEITVPFYEKFHARLNCKRENKKMYEAYKLMPLIIDDPEPISEIPIELADDFDYSSTGQTNPFEK